MESPRDADRARNKRDKGQEEEQLGWISQEIFLARDS
jgi:hypothetical protein